MSGFLMMIGQVADAVATPLIGLQSDGGRGLCGYGRRKTWHALGRSRSRGNYFIYVF